MSSLLTEKLEQAAQLLREFEIDLWLTFVRETSSCTDPVLPMILGQHLTWQSALIVDVHGDRVAIVGKYDDGAVRATTAWTEVIPYVQSIREPLVATLRRLDPKKIAVNFSQDDSIADGLTHGMFLLLHEHLAETPYANRIVGADRLIDALRGRKTASEVRRIRQSVKSAEDILSMVPQWCRPGRTEIEIAAAVKEEVRHRGLGLAWDERQCPMVNTGPKSQIGHGMPSDIVVEGGHVLHLDFGVREQDYVSDLQRCWFVSGKGDDRPSDKVRHAFEAVTRAIQNAAMALRPGILCWEVDAVARRTIVESGYPEYQHATGHHVGRSAHDGGGVLGPCWERYGNTPYRRVEVGNVFTLELGIEQVDGAGYIGLEEMVVVTPNGCEFISTPQVELPLV